MYEEQLVERLKLAFTFGIAALAMAFSTFSPPAGAQTGSSGSRVGAKIYDAPEEPEVKGRNAEAVIYQQEGRDGKIAGAFVKTGPTNWIEQNGDGRFTLKEIDRDEWSVYLRKTPGTQEIQLNLFPDVYSVAAIAYERRVVGATFYKISQAFGSEGSGVRVRSIPAVPMAEHVKGPNAQMVIVADIREGSLGGVLLQTGPRIWLAKTQQGTLALAEIKRDEWSIYLRDGRDRKSLQIDLYEKVVYPFDTDANRRSGPAEFEVLTAFATSTRPGPRPEPGPDPAPWPGPRPEPSKVTNFWIGSKPAYDNLVFVSRRGGIWKEYRKNGAEFAVDWRETARDATSVTLYDESRDYSLRLTATEAIIKTDGRSWVLIRGRWSTTPPAIPSPSPAATIPKYVKLRSSHNGRFMMAPAGVADNSLIYCRGTAEQALVFETDGTPDNMRFKLRGQNLWLSYRDLTGAVKLYSRSTDASYKLEGVLEGGRLSPCAIFNLRHAQYMGLGNYQGNPDEPYVVRDHKPSDPTSRWELVDATR